MPGDRIASPETLATRATRLEAENERLRAALREIAKLTHGNSNWAPGLAMRALGGHYEHAGI